jgi:hypothetical protein
MEAVCCDEIIEIAEFFYISLNGPMHVRCVKPKEEG